VIENDSRQKLQKIQPNIVYMGVARREQGGLCPHGFFHFPINFLVEKYFSVIFELVK